MKNRRWLPWILLALTVGGCVPKRYAWSPDGKWMSILSLNGLHFCDATGKLLPLFIPDVGVTAWFGDSQRVLVSKTIQVAKWDDLTHYLSAPQAAAVADAGQQACQALLAYDWTAANADSWDQFTAWFKAQEESQKHDLDALRDLDGAVAVYVRTYVDDAERQKIPPARLAELENVTDSVYAIQVYTISETATEAGPVVMTSLKQTRELRVSPSGQAAMVILPDEKNDDLSDLWVISTRSMQAALLVSDKSTEYPDWSVDGRSVVYIARESAEKSKVGVGSLSRARVIGDDGKLLANADSQVDLAGLVYDPFFRVRCLQDGRILFCGVPLTLPATPNDVAHHTELFAVTPGKQATVSRLLPKGSLDAMGDAAQYFEPSPDGTRVSIPALNGTVTVVDLASGEVTLVQAAPFAGKDSNDHLTLPSVPDWRTSDELTFMTPDATKLGKVVVWSLAKKSGKTISDGWPSGVIEPKTPAK